MYAEAILTMYYMSGDLLQAQHQNIHESRCIHRVEAQVGSNCGTAVDLVTVSNSLCIIHDLVMLRRTSLRTETSLLTRLAAEGKKFNQAATITDKTLLGCPNTARNDMSKADCGYTHVAILASDRCWTCRWWRSGKEWHPQLVDLCGLDPELMCWISCICQQGYDGTVTHQANSTGTEYF